MSRRGADVIEEALVAQEVDRAFGIISIHNMPLFDAFAARGRISVIDSRHEQAATHEADGFARATGRMGVALASTGPGTTNTVTGLYEAAYASSPVLLLTGQAETRYLGKGMGYVHEHEQQQAMLRTVAPHVVSPRHVAELAPAIARVARDMRSGRRQPGAVEVPLDLQYALAADAAVSEGAAALAPEPAEAALGSAVDLIQSCRRRLILAGGGVIGGDASGELVELAETLGAPVLTTHNGRGAIPEDHPLALGGHAQNAKLLRECGDAELTIAIGTRFQVGGDGRNRELTPPGRLLHIDVDPATIDRVHRADAAVVGDARATLRALLDNMNARSGDEDYLRRARASRGKLEQAARERIGPDHEGIMELLRASLPRETVVVRDSTIPAYFWANQLLPVYAPRTSISPASGAIGPGLPLALGAAVGTGRRTLVIHGDGGLQLHATELATAARHGIPILVCVFNDGGYGILRFLQRNRFEGRFTDTDLGTVDFARLAESLGVPARRVTCLGELERGLHEALAVDGPFLLDIDQSRLEPIAGMVAPRS